MTSFVVEGKPRKLIFISHEALTNGSEACRERGGEKWWKIINYLCSNRDYLDVQVWNFFSSLVGSAKGEKIFRLSFSLPLDFSRNFTNETHAIESFYHEVECLVTNICCFCFFGKRILRIDKKLESLWQKSNWWQLIEKQFNCVSFQRFHAISLSRDSDRSSLAFEAFCCGKKMQCSLNKLIFCYFIANKCIFSLALYVNSIFRSWSVSFRI